MSTNIAQLYQAAPPWKSMTVILARIKQYNVSTELWHKHPTAC